MVKCAKQKNKLLSPKQKFILPNKDFKKFILDSNKVSKSDTFLNYI